MSTGCIEYDFKKIEAHWQKYWEKNKTFRAEDFLDKPKYYILDMFPYPSGAGLHVGHPPGYIASDIIARYKKSLGFNVLHPMGWDAFGLPAEQYAISTGTHPRKKTEENINRFRKQFDRIGFALDWDREVNTTDPDYYKWTQWIILQMFKHGLVTVDDQPVWWCPALGTVLANEEVINGLSERGSHPVERRKLRQMVLRITAYAEKLLDGLKDLDWPDSTKRQQIAWIGRSEGAETLFDIDGFPDEKLKIFTTRPDTLFGATYMVLSPEHPLVNKLTQSAYENEVLAYIKTAATKSDLDRTDLAKEKTGVFTGCYAINPVNNEKLPIWIADYVLMGYGTGAIMAVPAHDERDYEFAQQFELPIIEVIGQKLKEGSESETTLPYSGEGEMINSGDYTGLESTLGKEKIIDDLEKSGRGKAAVNYKLRDWIFSRQRYWGEPFPIVWVDEDDYLKVSKFKKGEVYKLLPEVPVCFEADGAKKYALPIPASHLPVILPEMESFQPSGTGQGPLANQTTWLNVWFNLETGDTQPVSDLTPGDGNWVPATRETNTMPQWAGSCWYHLRYCDPQNADNLIDHKIDAYWKSPDYYIGGAEHAVLHLLYARFWHQFLHDIKVVSEPEPYPRLFHQGIILGEDGIKMSKSRGNVINPDDIIDELGADSLRLYEMFLGPLESMKPWSTHGIDGVYRFLNRVWREIIDRTGKMQGKIQENVSESSDTERLLHETIKKVTQDIETLQFNTAISQMMIFSNHLQKLEAISLTTVKTFIQLLAPLAPHIAEELWQRVGEEPSIVNAPWPRYDESKFERDEVKIIFQVNGKMRGEALVPADAGENDVLIIAREHPRVAPHLEGKSLRKVIFVPGKILNIVAN
jgi:leucyl-tRNA synthetase